MSFHLPTSEIYEKLVSKAQESHEQGRRADILTSEDISFARLYSYAFRTHIIGSFHATRLALESHSIADLLTQAQVRRAIEHLEDLVNMGMDDVPDDFRAVVSTFYRYNIGVHRVADALSQAGQAYTDPALARIAQLFIDAMAPITSGNGIYLTQDTGAPKQASFIVPNLGITIVPLMYGDHHSWNLAYLTVDNLDVPNHLHQHGVEIHLGYEPLEGYMVLDEYKAPANEGYALPIPPKTRHGWVNRSGAIHHVPFIFGSLKHAGWGVFADVVPQPIGLDQLVTVERESWKMGSTVYLEREIHGAAKSQPSRRNVLIPATVTDRDGSGGLELAVSRVNKGGMTYALDDFRIASVVMGRGRLRVGPAECEVQHHDHFGIPSGMSATMNQVGDEPLVLLDTVIRAR